MILCHNLFWFIKNIFHVSFVSRFLTSHISSHLHTRIYRFHCPWNSAITNVAIIGGFFFLQNSQTFHVSFLSLLLLFILLIMPPFKVIRNSFCLVFPFTSLPWLHLNQVFLKVFLFHHFCSSVFTSLFHGLRKSHLPLWGFFYFYWMFSLKDFI